MNIHNQKNSNGNIEYKLRKGPKFEGKVFRGVNFAKHGVVYDTELVLKPKMGGVFTEAGFM